MQKRCKSLILCNFRVKETTNQNERSFALENLLSEMACEHLSLISLRSRGKILEPGARSASRTFTGFNHEVSRRMNRSYNN